MQPLSLADEHPQGTTRTIFSETSIRRLCFITSLVLSHGFQLSNGKDLRGISQELNKPIKLHLWTSGRDHCTFWRFQLKSLLCPATKQQKYYCHETWKPKMQPTSKGSTLSFQIRGNVGLLPLLRTLPNRCGKGICRCRKQSRQKSCSHHCSMKLNY